MSFGIKANPAGASGTIQVDGVDKVVVTNAGDVAATTFTGALIGNADSATKLSTSTGTAPVYGVRAWVTFDPTKDSTGASNYNATPRLIIGSGNVSAVTKTSASYLSYSVSFTTALPTSSYCVISSVGNNPINGVAYTPGLFVPFNGSSFIYTAPSTSGFVFNIDGNNSTTNTQYVGFIVVG